MGRPPPSWTRPVPDGGSWRARKSPHPHSGCPIHPREPQCRTFRLQLTGACHPYERVPGTCGLHVTLETVHCDPEMSVWVALTESVRINTLAVLTLIRKMAISTE